MVLRVLSPASCGESHGVEERLLGSQSALIKLLFAGLFAINMTPETSFIFSDFWRRLVVHMWVEVAFEIFIIASVAYR